MDFAFGCMGAAGVALPPIGPRRPSRAKTASLPPHCAFLVLALGVLASRAAAQAPTVDTSGPALPGGSGSLLGSFAGGGNSLLGRMPGAGGGSFGNAPGTGGILGGRPGPYAPKGVPTAVTTPGAGPGPTE